MKNRHISYLPSDKMILLIAENYQLLQVLSRFGIPLGFGDKTVEEVCHDNKVDCNTFISIVNFMIDDSSRPLLTSKKEIQTLIHYLRQSHTYFLEFCLSSIRRKLLDSIELKDSDVSFLIIKLFDEYVNEVRDHMAEEEKTVFREIENLLDGKDYQKQENAMYSDNHEKVGRKLRELKSIIIRYCPSSAKSNLLNAALYDLYRCEEELNSHSNVEDFLLMPSILNFSFSKVE